MTCTLSTKDMNRIAELRNAGMAWHKIRAMVGRGKEQFWLAKKELESSGRVRSFRIVTAPAPAFTTDELNRIAGMVESLVSIEDIAKRFGRSIDSINRAIRKLKDSGRIKDKRYCCQKQREHLIEMNEQQVGNREDFSFAVYQYAATHRGSTDEMIAEATGYSLERVKAETKRLSSTLARLLTRDGNGWRQVTDRERHTTCPGGNAWAFLKNREAA